jgi:hypothetical protein
MGLFGKTKLVDEETRPHSDSTEDEGPKDNSFLGIHFPTTSSEPPPNATVSDPQSSTSPEELEDVGGRPPSRTNPSTYSTIITTESGKNGRPGLQSTLFFCGRWLIGGIPSEQFKMIEKALVRKLDLVIVPLTMFLYLFTFLDKYLSFQLRF